MKKKFAILFIVIITLSCSERYSNDRKWDPEEELSISSYSFGYLVAKQMFPYIDHLEKVHFIQGIEHGLRDNFEPSITEREMQDLVNELRDKISEERSSLMAEQDSKAQEMGHKFVERYLAYSDVQEINGGVLYRKLKNGYGDLNPDEYSVIKVNSMGSLPDGTVFFNSFDDEPISLKVNQVVPGLKEALKRMVVGDHWEIVVPPESAYQGRRVGNIPANSTLIFEVRIIKIE